MQACWFVKLQQESEASCLWPNRISCCIERICKFAKGRVCWHVSNYPSLAAIAMLGNLDNLVWREAHPGLARTAREGHGLNVRQPENDPALNVHNNVTLRDCSIEVKSLQVGYPLEQETRPRRDN